MKLLLVLLAIIAIAFASPINTQIMEGIEKLQEAKTHYHTAMRGLANVNQHLRNSHEAFLKKLEKPAITERSARVISDTCRAALANITFSPECRDYVAAFYLGDSVTVKSAAVDNYCSKCSSTFEQQIKAVLANCTREDIGDIKADFFKLGYYNRFLCSREGNEYCAKTLINLDKTILAKSFDQVTSDDLKKVCSACVIKALRISIQGGGFNNGTLELYAGLRVACVQIKGEYCILKIKPITEAANKLFLSGTQPTAEDFKNFLDMVCYPCFRAVLFRIISLGQGSQIVVLARVGIIFSRLCRKDTNGKYCLVRIYDAIKSLLSANNENAANVPCGQLTCDNTCKEFVANLVTKGGCCWALFIDFITSSGAGSSEIDAVKRAVYNFVRECAKIELPPPCPSVANGTLSIRYTNLDISTINKDINAFKQLVLLDLQSSFGSLDGYNNITVNTAASKRAGSTTTDVTIFGAVLPATAAGSLTDTSIACDSVCTQVPPNDPSADVTISNSASNVKVQSASSALSVSFVLLAALFVFQFFF